VVRTQLYYIPEARENDRYVFDGIFLYEGLSSLNGLNGKRKRRFRRFFRKIGKGLKKAGKITVKVVKKAIPVASTVASFIPGAGWAVSAGLTAAEMAIKQIDKKKKRRRKKLRRSNQSTNSEAIHNFVDKQLKNNAIYKKNAQLVRKTHKKIHISPVLFDKQALQKAINDTLQLIDLKTTNRTSAESLRQKTKEQLKIQEQNIINDVLRILSIY